MKRSFDSGFMAGEVLARRMYPVLQVVLTVVLFPVLLTVGFVAGFFKPLHEWMDEHGFFLDA